MLLVFCVKIFSHKIVLLYCSLIQVHENETFNCTLKLESLRSFGLADVIEDRDSPINEKRFFVRMPRPLLAILNKLCKTPIPACLLDTLRENYGDMQELVELYSLTNGIQAWNMLEQDKGKPLTLERLRPGATFIVPETVNHGGATAARRSILGAQGRPARPLPQAAARPPHPRSPPFYQMPLKGGDVKIRNGMDIDMQITGTRQIWEKDAEAVSVVTGTQFATSTAVVAGTYEANKDAVDVWWALRDLGILVGQSKGAVLKVLAKLFNETFGPAHMRELLVAMKKHVQQPHLYALELAVAHRVPNIDQIKAALPPGFDVPIVIIPGQSFREVMGPVFGGIFEWSISDNLKKLKEAAKEAGASGAHNAVACSSDASPSLVDPNSNVADVQSPSGKKGSGQDGDLEAKRHKVKDVAGGAEKRVTQEHTSDDNEMPEKKKTDRRS